MSHRAITALEGILRPQVGLGKSRLETLCLLSSAWSAPAR